MTRISNLIRGLVAGAVVAAASSAYAGPFTVNPNADIVQPGNLPLSPITQSFIADAISGPSSSLITGITGGPQTAIGYVDYTSFNFAGNGLGANVTGLGFYYGLYATFSQTLMCPAALSPGVTCQVQTISLNLYANPGNTDTFQQATLGGPTVTHSEVNPNDILLATVSAVIGGGLAGLNSLGGAYENINTNVQLTTAGSEFFTAPVPFYNLAFSEYNNTSPGLACSVALNQCAITQESGQTDFMNAPEPASLAIFGLGLAGLAALRRKKSA